MQKKKKKKKEASNNMENKFIKLLLPYVGKQLNDLIQN